MIGSFFFGKNLWSLDNLEPRPTVISRSRQPQANCVFVITVVSRYYEITISDLALQSSTVRNLAERKKQEQPTHLAQNLVD